MNTIYLVEDDENLREIVGYSMTSSGFTVREFEDSSGFWQAMEAEQPDLCLLDIMLPDEDGLAILQKLKANKKTKHIPVIMLTAKSGEMDRVKGLDFGADDYITKPFSVLELIARVKAVLRRSELLTVEDSEYHIGKLVVNEKKHQVFADGKEVILTYKEFEILLFLLKNQGYVLTRNLLMDRIWGYEYEGESRTVDVHVRTLRQKLGDSGRFIQTVRGVGYKAEEVSS